MNRKILSLLTALLLCLTLFPVQALAAGEEADNGGSQERLAIGASREDPTVGGSQEDLTIGVSEPDPAPMALQKAAARAGGISILSGFVFARGIPIVIKQNGSITSVYGEDGALLSGNTDVKTYSIYGGWNSGSNAYTADTSIVMESGTVKSLFGGSFSGTLNGNTNVVVRGGTITSLLYGGGNKSTLNGNTNVEVNGGTVAFAYGGGQYGTVAGTANISVNSGATVTGIVFGGGRDATVNSTNVTINGGTVDDGSDRGCVYGGGQGGSVKNTHVQLKNGVCTYSYGGSREGVVEQATVEMGVDWYSAGWVSAGGYNDTTGSAEVIVHNYATGDIESVGIDATTAQEATVIVRRDDGGPQNQANSFPFYLYTIGTWNVVVEYGTAILQTQTGRSITLGSLDIKPSAQLQFGDFDKIKINKVICNGGQFSVPASHLSSTWEVVPNVPVELGEIVLNVPLIIKAYGWTDEILEKNYFFYGAGVDALDSTDCLFVKNYDAVLKEIPGGDGAKGIYFQKKPEGTSSIYISKSEFNQNPVPYNGTISLTVGAAEEPAVDELVPNARIQIRGSNNRDVLFASIQVSADGKTAAVTGMDGVTRSAQVDGGCITITLPVSAELLDTHEEGLYALATTSNNQYSKNVQLVGPGGETEIEITPTPITLTKTIPEPAFQAPLQSELEDGAFYIASVRWRPVDNVATSVFQMNRDYQADIILTPKEGHWLSAESIGSTVGYNGRSVPCVFNTDGTVTLKNITATRFESCTVTVAASPAEGGTVTGGGVYLSGSQVTIKAEPAAGWRFISWTESGKEIAGTMEYRFSVTNHRNITAVFEKESEELETMLEIQNGISEVPPAFKDLEHLNTPEKITLAMRTAITQTGIPSENTVVYEVKLMISMDGGKTWVPASKDNFPAGGLRVTLPYPTGTDSGYTFTVVHMFTTSDFGKIPGDTEKPSVTNTVGGIQFTVTGLSPISIGWVKSGGSSGGDGPSSDGLSEGGTTSGSGHSSSSSTRNDEYDFWQSVRKKIEAAAPGDTVTVSTGDYERMPKSVMDALRQKDGVTLVLRRKDGEEIVIPSEKALDEAMRVYYPLPYLEKIDFSVTEPVLSPDGVTGSKPNPGTGGWNPAWGPIPTNR